MRFGDGGVVFWNSVLISIQDYFEKMVLSKDYKFV